MKNKTCNGQVLAELVCYLLFGGTILYLILSNRYLSYVTPKMKPYLYFTVAVMLIWTGVSLTGLFRLQRRKRTAHCLVLIIPVLLLLMPHGAMNASSLSGTAGLLTGNAVSGVNGGLGNGGGTGGSIFSDQSSPSSEEDNFDSNETWGDDASDLNETPAGGKKDSTAMISDASKEADRSGTSGAPGSSGTAGTTGASSTAGSSDSSGASNASRSSDASGSSGTSGSSGAAGSSGSSGTASASNDSRSLGSSGTANASNASRSSGSSGMAGSSDSSNDSRSSDASGTSCASNTSRSSDASGTSRPSGSSGTSRTSNASGTAGFSSGSSGTPDTTDASNASSASKPNTPDRYMTTDPYTQPKELHGYDAKNKTIVVSNDEFYDWVNEFFTNFDQLKGFQVTMTGAVYKDDPTLTQNEFVPVRLAMTCCVADLTPMGLVCTYDKVSQLKSDQWVTVTGTLYQGKYEKQNEPRLKILTVKAAKPVPGYLYPYA